MDDSAIGPRNGKKIKRLLLCTGKVYFDLLEKKEEDKRDDVAIVRMEQLYPLPKKQLNAIFDKYKNAEKYWVQEEPENMGVWRYLLSFAFRKVDITPITRKPSASPATGFKEVHKQTQAAIVEQAFA